MKGNRWWVVVFAGAIAVPFAFQRWRAAQQDVVAGPPEKALPIEVLRETLDFGTVGVQSRFPWCIRVRNRSAMDVVVEDVYTSCRCTIVDKRSFTIPAGQIYDLNLIIDLRVRTGKDDSAARDFATDASFRIKDESRPARWELRGRVIVPFVVQPSQVRYDDRSELAPAFPSQILRVSLLRPIESLSVECTAEGFRAALRPVPDSRDYQIELRSNDAVPPGDLSGDIIIRGRYKDGRSIEPYHVPISGRIVCDVQTNPSHIVLPAAALGTFAEETISLRSLTGRRFAIVRWEAAGAGLTIQKDANGSNAFVLRQEYHAEREQQTKAVFIVRDDAGKEKTATVRIQYFGIKTN